MFRVRRSHRLPAPAPLQHRGDVGELTRRACIDALVAMLVNDRLSEEEFELRWKVALEATTSAELDRLLYDVDWDDEGAGAS